MTLLLSCEPVQNKPESQTGGSDVTENEVLHGVGGARGGVITAQEERAFVWASLDTTRKSGTISEEER